MMISMRTTVTLDDDTAALLRRHMDERGIGFKEALNNAIREGTRSPGDRIVIATPVHAMGTPRVVLDRALALAAQLEDDELVQRMREGE